MIPLATALAYREAGLSVLPAVKAKKYPAIGSWKSYQEHLPTEDEVRAWFSEPRDAVAIVCGAVSGNLEVVDFDQGGELFDAWREAIPPELFARLVVERSPSGGYHVLYRCAEPVDGNTKLAVGERDGKLSTLIETRGSGGLILSTPSDGYTLVQGSFTDLPVLTAAERENLLAAAAALNEHFKVVEPSAAAPAGADPVFGVRPGDDFNARGDLKALLVKHGWKELYTRNGNVYFRRPDKEDDGVSASFDGTTFYVFSSNAAPFEPGTGYSPFSVFAELEFDGDRSKAAGALLELGFGKKKETTGVDLSGILAKCAEVVPSPPAPEEKLFPDPGPFPEELLEIPGFMRLYMKLSLEVAPYPNALLALGSGMTFLSLLCGRLYADRRGVFPNLFWVSLAGSGTGKEIGRQINKKLAMATGLMGCIGDTFASGEGLEDAMFRAQRMLFQVDEMDCLFNTLKLQDGRAEGINDRLLKFYSSSSTSFIMRAKATTRKKEIDFEDGASDLGVINYPYLVLHGTAIPSYFYESLTHRVMENGLIPRMLIVDVGKRGQHGDPKMIEPPPELIAMIEVLKAKAVRGGHIVREKPEIQIVAEAPEATELLKKISSDCDEKYAFFDARNEIGAMALWARAFEKICKLALLYAASVYPADPKITVEAVMWAASLVFYLTERTLYLADNFLFQDQFDKKCQRIVRFIKQEGRVTHSRLLRRSHESSDSFKKIITTLVENGRIVREVDASTNPATTSYRLA